MARFNSDYVFFQDSCIPPSERCRYNNEKASTGPYDRKALIDFLETKAKEEKDWDEVKPYAKEVRGKLVSQGSAVNWTIFSICNI